MNYLACDLGAESGRVMLGSLDNDRLVLEEIHRFPNVPIKAGASLHWDVRRLFDEVKVGLRKASERRVPIAGISTDSWGVDYLLLDEQASVMSPTFHYRDPRTQAGVDAMFARVGWEKIFGETGIQFMPLNTIFQLAAEPPERLRQTRQIIGIGDGINFLLSGVARSEVSLASTYQLYNPVARTWSDSLLEAIGVSVSQFPAIVPSGTRLGPLHPSIAAETGLGTVEVIASCSHDTGAAVAAVPGEGKGWAYLSSGTWSLMGVEWPTPVISPASRELNFTNEIGFGNTVRLLKNLSGLWLVQECRREWAREGTDLDYSTLTRLASEAPAFRSFVNPADSCFLAPDGMPSRVAEWCRQTGQPVPSSPGEFVRCALESLALLYRRTLRQIEQLTGSRVERLHVVGGGSRNALLNQFTANALEIPVLAGPVEATAAGNILVQAIALGHLPSLAAARSIVRQSMEVTRIEPQDAEAWRAAGERFDRMLEAGAK
jgi:rhamnulokinase